MRFPRITTRRLMALVAAVALAIELWQMGQTSVARWELAEIHEEIRERGPWRCGMSELTPEGERKWEAYRLQHAGYHGAHERKYRRAALRPWMGIAPAPPFPLDIDVAVLPPLPPDQRIDGMPGSCEYRGTHPFVTPGRMWH